MTKLKLGIVSAIVVAAGNAAGLARAALGIQTLGYRSGAQNAELLDLLREASRRLEEAGGPLALRSRVLAAQDRRVLLLDAELRRPSLKALLADPGGMGLEELLRGEALLQEAAQPSRIPGVDVLGADEELLGAADMASSPRFRLALKTARERYDFIVIDSAPLNLISESALIARRADATVLVVRLGVTSRTTALAAQKRMADMKVRILGAVVNGTRPSSSFNGYRNRRDVSREEAAIVRGGDDLVGIA
jgi:Mrp family chromosome partitioning ATPase